jgi:hypothetical protein
MAVIFSVSSFCFLQADPHLDHNQAYHIFFVALIFIISLSGEELFACSFSLRYPWKEATL